MFSHGSNGHPDKFTKLLGAWAGAGYVVAAPAFPLTNSTVPGNPGNVGDVVNQPADVSFVLTRLLRLDQNPEGRLSRAIDRKRIGAAGLSLGGATTYGVVFDHCCRDPRFTAAMVLDGILIPLSAATGAKTRLDGHVPLLIAHSDTDPTLPYATARSAYEQAAGPAWLVTLHGASHASQWENDRTRYDAIDTALDDRLLGRDPPSPAGVLRPAHARRDRRRPELDRVAPLILIRPG